MRAQLVVACCAEKSPLLRWGEELLATVRIPPNHYQPRRMGGGCIVGRRPVWKANVDGHVQDVQVSNGKGFRDRSRSLASP